MELWDGGEGVCCAAFQLGACIHTESQPMFEVVEEMVCNPVTDQLEFPECYDGQDAVDGIPYEVRDRWDEAEQSELDLFNEKSAAWVDVTGGEEA